jgi:hypothetical protein
VSKVALRLVRPELLPGHTEPPVEAMFRFLGTDVRVVSASVRVLQDWTARYGAFRVLPGPPEITVRVHREDDAAPAPGQVTIEWSGFLRTWQGAEPVLPPVTTPPLDRWTYLHGAAVGRTGHAVLLLGEPGAGKTLLALTLVASGANLLADGLLPLDEGDMLLAPFLEAIRLRRDELDQLTIDPAHPALGPVRTPSGMVEWRADPHGLLGQRAARVAAGVAAMVFLQAGTLAREPRLEPVAPAVALQRLQRSLYRPAPDPGRTRPALARVCQQVPAFTLTAGPLRQTARLVDGLLA